MVKIASNACSIFDKKAITPRKPEPRTKMHYCNLHSQAQNKGPLMKKEATPKCNGLKQKIYDEKRGNPKIQGAQNKIPPMKKEATPKCKRPQRAIK
jgi:hypothetical protein